MIGQRKAIAFNQIIDRDQPFMLLIGIAAPDGGFIQHDGDQLAARIGALIFSAFRQSAASFSTLHRVSLN